jgi:hypothetical protein
MKTSCSVGVRVARVRRPREGAIRGFMMVSIGRMVILGWISFISMIASR